MGPSPGGGGGGGWDREFVDDFPVDKGDVGSTVRTFRVVEVVFVFGLLVLWPATGGVLLGCDSLWRDIDERVNVRCIEGLFTPENGTGARV